MGYIEQSLLEVWTPHAKCSFVTDFFFSGYQIILLTSWNMQALI